MTVTDDAAEAGASVVPTDHITATIDDIQVVVPKGTLVIRAAEQIGLEVPRFCDHPALDPVAACRMCLIEIEGMPKPQPACAIPLTDGMVVHTQYSSPVAKAAQEGVMEFLLVNHPLDCPICDKGGECPLQNQAMSAGRDTSRFDGRKRTFPKPINVSAEILLDRERCVSCQRCTRFSEEIAGDPFIDLLERGAAQQIGIAEGHPFDSYFSGNTVQICPVGALTSADYRFRSRPFDLVSTPTVCEHCAAGCALRTDTRRSVVMRRLAGEDPEVNEDWNCDKGRFAFPYLTTERLATPLVRDEDTSELRVASWPEAITVAAELIGAARGHGATLIGGRFTQEDAYAFGKFTRVVMDSDDLDFRVRVSSPEEYNFLTAMVAGVGVGVTYAELEHAPLVVLAGLEPEEESPIVFLRLRKALTKGSTAVVAVAEWDSPGFVKLGAEMRYVAPGGEAEALAALADGEHAEALRQPGSVILVGERLAGCPGALSAAVELAQSTGAELAWIPRRAGERGSLDAGALAGVLPGGRPLADAGARAEVAAAWKLAADALPTTAGRTRDEIIEQLLVQAAAAAEEAAVAAGEAAVAGGYDDADDADGDEAAADRIDVVLLAGVDSHDLPDPVLFTQAMAAASIVQLTPFAAAVHPDARVVLPVKVLTERSGSFTNWEGRVRPFGTVLRHADGFTDGEVLGIIAREAGHSIGAGDPEAVRRELAALDLWGEDRPTFTPVSAQSAMQVPDGHAVLATWKHLLDDGVTQAGEPHLAATRRPSVVRLSATTAEAIGAADEQPVTVATDAGAITLPLVITEMPDDVVWLPEFSPGSHVHDTLRATAGALVRIAAAAAGGAQ